MARRRGVSVLDDCVAANEARSRVGERWELVLDQVADGRGAELPNRVNGAIRQLVTHTDVGVTADSQHSRAGPLVGEDGRDGRDMTTSVLRHFSPSAASAALEIGR